MEQRGRGKAVKVKEGGRDHLGRELPNGISAITRNEVIVGYRVRWREEDEYGISRQPSKSFSARRVGSLDLALTRANHFLADVQEATQNGQAVTRPPTPKPTTPNDVFREWIVIRGTEVSSDYAEESVRLWSKEIEWRPIANARLDRISEQQSLLVAFQDELAGSEMTRAKRRVILKLFRAVLRWGRLRHPDALRIELAGLIQVPKQSNSRLAYAADAIGLERLIEAILKRPARDDLRPLRDAAFAAAVGFTVASRPSEWRQSATWQDLRPPTSDGGFGTVELQRANGSSSELIEGLKTGAHVALVLPNAWDRIAAYRAALEERFGPQPPDALIFQVIGDDGPEWIPAPAGGGPIPLAMDKYTYQRWVARVWVPARTVAAQAPDAPPGLDQMVFYDCRHTAISMALHSTLVLTEHGMNLHPLGSWAGHDIETLQRYYRHFIARYMGQPPIDLVEECAQARAAVEANPFTPEERVSPQREFHQRRQCRERPGHDRGKRGHIPKLGGPSY